VATISSLVDKVRVELGDIGKSFVTQFVADGSTNRFILHYAPLDASLVQVYKNGVDISDYSTVEESTGILVLDDVPADGDALTVSGNYYRYFTAAELASLVTSAVEQHSAGHTDSLGRKMTVDTLPLMEEYPVTVYATTLALYTLATDAAFDIDIQAPDGVTIPRAERYRQLMEMIQTRQAQYKDLCVQLGVGLYRIDVFTLRRVSKATGRYVPVYIPQEVDDRSYPQRVDDQLPTYGNRPVTWATEAGDLTAYQGRSYTTSIDYTGNLAGKLFVADLLNQRGSTLIVQPFTLSVDTTGIDSITGAARTSGSTTITITTSAAHGLSTGNSVVITGVHSTVDGVYTILSGNPANTTFTVTGTATTALALTGLTGQVETNVSKDYTFTLSLTKDQTLRLAERTYWSLSTIDAFTSDRVELKGGNFFTARVSSVVI
jgi:hypothetical protein